MEAIAKGDLETEVAGSDRGDELGQMAKTVMVFRDAGLEKVRLEAQAAEQAREAEEERRRNAEAQAQAAEEQAREREQDVRRFLAESYEQAAQLALQRGNWTAALENFDKALDADYPDLPRLRLNRVRAWSALHNVAKASEELEALAQRSDLGDAEGAVLLWQADLVLSRSVDDARALELVQKALDKGLSPAESAYAQGLLAKSSDEALAHFQQAIQKDPFHHRAHGMLALLLILLGRLTEAHERVDFGERVFPDDPAFKVLHALQVSEEDLQGARDLIDHLAGPLTERQVKAARALVNVIHQARRLDLPIPGSDARIPLFLAWGQLGLTAIRLSNGFPDLYLPIPPVLVKGLGRLPALLPRFFLGDYGPIIEASSQAVHVHPDGFLYYWLGLLLAENARWTEAEAAFLAATEKSSLIPVRRQALIGAVFAEYMLFDEASPPELQARIVKNLRQLEPLGRFGPAEAKNLGPIAFQFGEFAVARRIVTDWEQQAPDDPNMLRTRAAVELAEGAYGRAIKDANKVLDKWPDDKRALDYRAKAITSLRKSAASLAPDEPKHPQ
jgi:tetratricopeptide (TPR) repeat protein